MALAPRQRPLTIVRIFGRHVEIGPLRSIAFQRQVEKRRDEVLVRSGGL